MQDLQYLLPLSKDWTVYLHTCQPQCLLQYNVSYTIEIEILISLGVWLRSVNSGTLFTKHAEIGKFTDLLRKVYATFTEILRRIHKASVNFVESTEGFRKFYGTTHSSVGVRSVISLRVRNFRIFCE